MSISDPSAPATEFDGWLKSMVDQHGEFTTLVILTRIADAKIEPLCSTYFHVIGDEVAWDDIVVMFAGAGQSWDGAAFFPTKAAHGGPVDNPTAHKRLRELEQKVAGDRMILNDGEYFDTRGRRLRIDPVGAT